MYITQYSVHTKLVQRLSKRIVRWCTQVTSEWEKVQQAIWQ